MKGNYYAVSAKIKSMHRTCLTEKEYEQLLTKRSVGDICAYLKNNTGYAKVLSNVNDREIHRLDLERLLKQELREEYVRMYEFMEQKQRKMLRFWFEREEIEFMKHILRSIFSGEQGAVPRFDTLITPFFRTHTKIDLELMAKARTFAEFTEACKDTIYYDILKRAAAVKINLFSVAMMLDRFYYASMWREKEKNMSAEDVRTFSEYLGSHIDMLNILWIYRSKKYFTVDNEMIYTYLIPVRYKLKKEDIRILTDADNAEQIEAYLADTPYAPLFQNIGKDFFAEENYNRMIFRIAKKLYKTAPLSMTVVFAYFLIRETEIKNLQTIIEGIRYGFEADAIREHLCL